LLTSITLIGDTFLNLLKEAHPDFYTLFHDYQWQNLEKIGMISFNFILIASYDQVFQL
jgi:hypothetical protein